MAERKTWIRTGSLLAASAAALLMTANSADAAFPGRNGELVFQHQAPAGDHTQSDVYMISPDGSGVRRLTATPNRNEFDPAWNAAGTRIAFWRTPAPAGYGALWVMNADGSGQRRLTGTDVRGPAWSPSGAKLVVARAVGSGFDLWTIRSRDGSWLHRLTSRRTDDFEPAWSPDGRRIAFTRAHAQGDPGNIAVLDLRTGRITLLTSTKAYDHQVAWSPDGRSLTFERDHPNSSAIFVISAEGGTPRRLTGGPYFDVGPSWSPDGGSIAFCSDRSGGILAQLWVMRADGSDLRQIAELPYSNGVPDWQPVA